ncbi:hypothetical protein GALL_53440 [mine drainage metagenome]|uniref:DUF403 domain-containing protein n=1 Tax=mine drainage metagenome TaxID=410659 RepID=A0A1J5SYG2_9ZZZZ
MLSRVADSIYWMSRYVERAENVARFIEVNLNLMLDSPAEAPNQWKSLVNTTGDHEDFSRRYPGNGQDDVLRFLTSDADNPNSVFSCIRAARENARSVREIISSEMWIHLNTFYLMLKEAAVNERGLSNPTDFVSEVRQSSHLFAGVTDATMTHSEGWHFGRLGRMIERADKTSRLLDVKYYLLLRSIEDVGTPFDDIQWAAVLRSASAFEMYRKRHGRISPVGVVEFLLLDKEFPRAVRFSLLDAQASLHAISGTPLGAFRHEPERHMGLLCSDLAYTSVEEILRRGLHEYVDELQTRLNQIGNGIHEAYFALKAPGSSPAAQFQA